MVRDAFALRGHFAVSCDLDESETPGRHIRGDVRDHLNEFDGQPWDMMLAFPPCTYLTRAGARYWADPSRRALQDTAVDFVRALWTAPIPRVCIENPPGCLSSRFSPIFQTIQPWQFGHGYTKLTCLWLRGIPPLIDTVIHRGRTSWTEKMGQSKQRSRRRSRTFQGIAEAMANQWTNLA
ncbi:MAG TPA: DNA cytosine methyltransferase [Phycisphaerae bacterium]|nr:DNA cytosine methyltransferase [Phycisphaerae bacterium]